MSEQNIFDKFLSRPYSLLHVEAYNTFLGEIASEIGSKATYPVFVYDKSTKLVTLYYNMAELVPLINRIGEKITNDHDFRRKIFFDFLSVFNEIKKYFDGEKKVNNLAEFEQFFILFKDYIKLVAYTWVIPDQKAVPQEIRDEAMNLRLQTESYAGRRDTVMLDFLKNYLTVPEEYLRFVNYSEVSKKPADTEVLARERSGGFIFYKGELATSDKMEQFKIANSIVLRESPLNTDGIITGNVAYKGVVKGLVRLVFSEDDLSKIKSNEDILVSPMTRPEFVPAMKLAGAMITDEGGIICHAAIVARELKKPCIISTKIATKVLKDGDMVEVDAEKGTVRIL